MIRDLGLKRTSRRLHLAASTASLHDHSDQGQHGSQGEADESQEDLPRLGRVAKRLSGQELPILTLHGGHDGADLLHEVELPAGEDPLERRVSGPLTSHPDRLAELDERFCNERHEGIEEPTGPEKYNINRDAEVTVILYKERVVKANHCFAKGKLSEKDVEMVSAEIGKLVK